MSRTIRVGCAAALATVFAIRVFVAFDGVRVKLIRESTPVTSGSISVPTSEDQRSAALDAPVALIAVVRNAASQPQRFSVTADGVPVCEVSVAAGDATRADCVITGGWSGRAPPVIEISAGGHPWALEFLEVATHHGSSTRLFPFHILPDTSVAYQRPRIATVLQVFILLCLMFWLPWPTVWTRTATRVHIALSVMAGAWVGAILVAPWISSFLLVMPVRSFVVIAGIVLMPQVAGAAQAGVRATGRLIRSRWIRRPEAGIAAVAMLVIVPYGLVVQENARQFSGNYSGLLRVSQHGFDRSPLFSDRTDVRASLALSPDEGYDAQFMYFAAFDPLLRRYAHEPQRYRAVVDAPPYRFGRIGFTWLTRGLALNQWRWYPVVMVGLVLLGIAATAGATAWLAHTSGRSVWWGLLILAVPGFWQSVRVVLPEPIAAGTLLLGYCCVRQRRLLPAIVLFALSLLIRETGLVLVALIIAMPSTTMAWHQRRWLVAAVVPFLIWRVYVAGVLWPDWGWEGLLFSASNIGIPLHGIVDLWSELARDTYFTNVYTLARAATWYPAVLLAVGGGAWLLRRTMDARLALALGVYVLISLSFTHPVIWGHVGNAQRGSYEMFVLFAAGAVSAPVLSRRDRGVLITCAVFCAAFILFGAHDALETRDALFP